MASYDVRDAICEVGHRVWQRGAVASNDGNISYRLDEDTVLCTPTMVSKGALRRQDLVLVDMGGRQVAGARKLTSEIRLHINIYRVRRDVRSVVHTHAPHALAFAATGERLPRGVIPEIEWNLGEVPLVPYVRPGTWAFARSLDPWLDTHDAFMMANHGCVTLGADPFDAYYRHECLENYAQLCLMVRNAGMQFSHLAPEDFAELIRSKQAAGLSDQGAGLTHAQRTQPYVAPRRARPRHFRRLDTFSGIYPQVTDEPKLSTAPPPADDPPVELTRADIEAMVREALAGED